MAELSYDDVRRASQEAVANMQSALNDLRNQLQYTRGDVARINGVFNEMANVQRIMGAMTQMMQRLDMVMQQRVQQGPGDHLRPMLQNFAQIELRLANIEQFAADMGHYLQAIHEHLTGQPYSPQRARHQRVQR